MAKRKKKDTTSELISMFGFGIVGITVYQTNSIGLGIFLALFFLAIIFSLMAIKSSKERQRIRKSGIEEIDKMTGIQFEEFLRLLFMDFGYDVKRTPKSGDYGADLVLEKNQKRIVVQAKRYKSTVGIKAVQEVSSARLHYKAHETWVITNSTYTAAAKKLAESNKVRLIARDQLISILLKKGAAF